MTERTEWPTAEKIARLRAEGVVSYSGAATRCFIVSGVALVVRISAAAWSEVVYRYREVVGREEYGTAWWGILKGLVQALVSMGSVIGVLVLLVALIQTRFLFLPQRLSPRLDRLNPLGRLSFVPMIRGVLGVTVRIAVGGVLAAIIFGVFFRDMAALLNHGLDYMVGHAREAFEGACVLLAAGAFGCGVVVWALDWLVFRLRHRMTRAEVLADRAET